MRLPFKAERTAASEMRQRASNKLGTLHMSTPVIEEPILREEERLETLVQRRLGGRVRDLRIRQRAHGIILQGRAATYHAKQLAQHAAMELTGRPIVANDIEVC